MKRAILIFSNVLLSILILLVLPARAFAQWQVVADGIEYQKFTLPDPNDVFVTRLDRSNPNLTLETSIGQGKLVSGRETVSSQASRYDEAINFWGQSWGSRNDAVVAINGSFEDPTADIPASGQIHSGWYAKRFDDLGGGSGFAWKLDRTAFIGGCVYHRPEKQLITFTKSGNTQQFNGINFSRGSDELVIYTPQYDSDTNTDSSGVEVLVEMTRPSLVLPEPAMAKGHVRDIRDGRGSTPIPFDHVVLSATGTARTTLLANIAVGDEIGISQEITQFADGCSGTLSGDWTKTYASVSGSFEFLKNGVIQSFADPGATSRHPRTAIAFNDSSIFFIVVDGRDPARSIGMTIQDLSEFTKNILGATWGINQDGGGSSTMVVNGQVKNNPSDGSERPVVNGMLMVINQAMQRSTAFSPNEPVTTVATADIRLGPGTNYAALSSVPANSDGVVIAHFNNLNGVLAKGSYWWKVDVAGTVGWVTQQSLRLDTPPAGTIVESRAGGLNYSKYSDSGLSDSPLKSTAPGTTLGIGSRQGSLKKSGSTRAAVFSYTPTITGTYEIYSTWAASSENHAVVEHIVAHAGGTTSILVDQATGENTWNSLGRYEFTAGVTYTAEIANRNYKLANNSSKVFRADAILWELISATPVGSLAGTVTNALDGMPISGATVLVEETSQSTTTITDGSYTMSGVPTGTRTLTAAVTGFTSASQSVTVSENQTTTVNFSLTPLLQPVSVRVPSITYATTGGKNNDRHLVITVSVTDNTGQPVTGAAVTLGLYRDTLFDSSFAGTTGTDGTLVFTRQNAPSSCYESVVTDVAAGGLTWDGTTPVNGFCK